MLTGISDFCAVVLINHACHSTTKFQCIVQLLCNTNPFQHSQMRLIARSFCLDQPELQSPRLHLLREDASRCNPLTRLL